MANSSGHSTRSRNKERPKYNKSTITVVALILSYPLGLLLTWFWTKWSLKLKILVTIPAILTLLFTLFLIFVIVKVRPNELMQTVYENNDKVRQTDINELAKAIRKYHTDNGQFPVGITTEERYISSTYVNLCSDLVPKYLSKLPVDPTPVYDKIRDIKDCSGFYETGYKVRLDEQGSVIVSSTSIDSGETFTASE